MRYEIEITAAAESDLDGIRVDVRLQDRILAAVAEPIFRFDRPSG